MKGAPGVDPAVAAGEASRRLERTRRTALDRALAEERRRHAAQIALSLAQILCEEDPGLPAVGQER